MCFPLFCRHLKTKCAAFCYCKDFHSFFSLLVSKPILSNFDSPIISLPIVLKLRKKNVTFSQGLTCQKKNVKINFTVNQKNRSNSVQFYLAGIVAESCTQNNESGKSEKREIEKPGNWKPDSFYNSHLSISKQQLTELHSKTQIVCIRTVLCYLCMRCIGENSLDVVSPWT